MIPVQNTISEKFFKEFNMSEDENPLSEKAAGQLSGMDTDSIGACERINFRFQDEWYKEVMNSPLIYYDGLPF